MPIKVTFNTNLNEGNKEVLDCIKKYIREKYDLSTVNIVEVGSGHGRWGSFLAPFVKSYIGIEPDKEYLRMAKEVTATNTQYLQGTGENIPLTGKYEVFLFMYSWHFMKKGDKALSELKRLLKKEGIIIIVEPSEKTEKWASSKLTKGSKEFDQCMYDAKIKDLKKARELLEKQSLFKIVKEGTFISNNALYWVLENP
jgi:ubiquinone/menaquinone biosynthesis C-methylase UbiE